MTASENIARLEILLRAERRLTASLRAQLAAQGVQPYEAPPAWTEGLTPNEIGIMEMLLAAHPKPVRLWVIEENLPKRDHALERSLQGVRVHVRNIRRVLGRDAIRNIYGVGYRCSDAFRRQYAASGALGSQ